MASKPLDSSRVDATRAWLTQYSLPERTYRRLVKTLAQNSLPSFSIGAEIGPSAPAIFKRKRGGP